MLKRISIAAGLCLCASAIPPLFAERAANDLLVYVGTYTGTTSKGIYVSRLSPSGALSNPELAVATPNPSFLALTPDARFLYAVNEIKSYGGQSSGSVSAFALHRDTGMLT